MLSRQRKFCAVNRRIGTFTAALQPHRHHDEFAIVPTRLPDKAAGITIQHRQRHLLTIDRAQCVQQVIDVKADFDVLSAVGDLELFLCLFLLWRPYSTPLHRPTPCVCVYRQQNEVNTGELFHLY